MLGGVFLVSSEICWFFLFLGLIKYLQDWGFCVGYGWNVGIKKGWFLRSTKLVGVKLGTLTYNQLGNRWSCISNQNTLTKENKNQ